MSLPSAPGAADPLQRLRETFDAMLLAEVRAFGGIPHLLTEQIELREAIATLLAAPPVPEGTPNTEKMKAHAAIAEQWQRTPHPGADEIDPGIEPQPASAGARRDLAQLRADMEYAVRHAETVGCDIAPIFVKRWLDALARLPRLEGQHDK